LTFHAAAGGIVYLGSVKTFLLTIVIAAGIANAQRPPVVVELFTSEGCSSCPPADNLLARLPRAFPDIDIIPLSEHVDYWNNLGWKDRFSSDLFSARQQDYGRTFRLESVYTPQMVVNGQAQFSGGDEARARREILIAASGPKASATLSMLSPGTMHVVVDHVPEGVRNADVFLAVTESGLESSPNKGENNGARLRHTGVVRTLTSLAHIDIKRSASYSADAKLNPNPEWRQENLQYVVFVQDRGSRKLIGAATLRPFASNR
jgi:hypothetical protein